MKFNLKYLKLIALIAFIAIIANQVVWIRNMYHSYQYELEISIKKSLEQAVFIEASDCAEAIGGILRLSPEKKIIENRFVHRTITTEDTTFVVEVDRYDPHSTMKIMLYGLKDDMPINVNRIDTIFRESLSTKFPIENTKIEYIDLVNNSLIEASRTTKELSSFIESEIFPIDIMDSTGMKAYVESPTYVILKNMIFQLIWSVILISIGTICILYLLQSIFHQRKEEKMRQSSINTMTHEFKRPISGAIAQLSLFLFLYDKGKYADLKSNADSALLELNKLTAYTERIQRISNSDKNYLSLNISTIEIKPFFENLINKYLNSEDEKPIDIRLNIETELKSINIDLLHFSNVMDNLIENAIKYSDKEIVIEISISDTIDNNILISVKDNGIGISSTEKKYIFDKFYRGCSKSAQSKSGFGLGLTYVKSIVEGHNGSVSVESVEHEGSEFILLIPKPPEMPNTGKSSNSILV